MTEQRQSKHPARRVAAILAACGGILALCGGGVSAESHTHTVQLTASRSAAVSRAASKQATLPQCGATRDPFDPTDSSSAPVGC